MQAVHHFAAGKRRSALSDLQLRDRLNQLEQLHILPEHRVQPDLPRMTEQKTSGGLPVRNNELPSTGISD